ncbi:hypothetical protein KP509_02G053200 [Ceratopteris richardii]|uniref:Uncharacterized protein n=1 Tax=Ceratopteris richardii TaxID=49495 RepID=A0A8T2VE14_CERRI|nr:hypothetical protein KP509_02G053200 [Ceratopteris richardii]
MVSVHVIEKGSIRLRGLFLLFFLVVFTCASAPQESGEKTTQTGAGAHEGGSRSLSVGDQGEKESLPLGWKVHIRVFSEGMALTIDIIFELGIGNV